jgi:hypothetical protein
MSLIDKSLPLEVRIKNVVNDVFASCTYIFGERSIKEINKLIKDKKNRYNWWIDELTEQIMKEVNAK